MFWLEVAKHLSAFHHARNFMYSGGKIDRDMNLLVYQSRMDLLKVESIVAYVLRILLIRVS